MAWQYVPDGMPNFPFMQNIGNAQPIPPVSASEAKQMKKTVKLLQALGVIPPTKKDDKKDDKKKLWQVDLPTTIALLHLLAPVVVTMQFLAVKFMLNQLIQMAQSIPHAN